MGFDRNTIRLLLNSIDKKTEHKNILTLGRQVMYISRQELLSLLNEFHAELPKDEEFKFETKDYCEGFLKVLGAEVIDSIDASDYEAATIVHDMNKPIDNKALLGKYDLVIDSGTLEHIFNFPVAVENCMKMVKTGGYHISFTPANNLFGHGFYQFSPELFYRIFSRDNGFEVTRMILFETGTNSRFYEIKDPASIRNRITMVNSKRVYLFVMARKVEEVPIFAKTPQQSDYENVRWQGQAWQPAKVSNASAIKNKIKKILSSGILDYSFRIVRKLKIMNRVTGNMPADNFEEVKI